MNEVTVVGVYMIGVRRYRRREKGGKRSIREN